MNRSQMFAGAFAVLALTFSSAAKADAQVIPVGGTVYTSPYTGERILSSTVYSPYAGTYYQGVNAFNPWTRQYYRGVNTYSPYTGNVYRGYNAFNGITTTYYGGNRIANPYWGRAVGNQAYYSPWRGGGVRWFRR